MVGSRALSEWLGDGVLQKAREEDAAQAEALLGAWLNVSAGEHRGGNYIGGSHTLHGA